MSTSKVCQAPHQNKPASHSLRGIPRHLFPVQSTERRVFSSPLMFTLPIRSETAAPATMSLLAHAVNQNTRRGIGPPFLPLKDISTEMKHNADGGIKAAGPPTGGSQEAKIVVRFWTTLSNCHWSKCPH